MSAAATISRIAALGLLTAACAGGTSKTVETIPVSIAMTHMKAEQRAVARENGPPQIVRVYLTLGITRWVYCDRDGEWARVVDFDGDGRIIVSTEIPTSWACGTSAPEAH
ncbi:MAG: hypothetical protein PHU25_11930 [Deltaproteobacteria bacterium]|nr:hypothetical protein [Deltaproteobacteria bacterium]